MISEEGRELHRLLQQSIEHGLSVLMAKLETNEQLLRLNNELAKAMRYRLERLEVTLTRIGEQMATELKAIEDQVAANAEVVSSVVVLLDGLAKKIEDSKNDPVKVQKIVDDLRTQGTTLGEAVKKNTPAE